MDNSFIKDNIKVNKERVKLDLNFNTKFKAFINCIPEGNLISKFGGIINKIYQDAHGAIGTLYRSDNNNKIISG